MRTVILQSNYIPWKGYFDLLEIADQFVYLDEVQYTHSDWRNRNRIKTASGAKWLTVPVAKKGRIGRTIDETVASNDTWPRSHWDSIRQAYGQAPYWCDCESILASRYRDLDTDSLSQINRRFISVLSEALDIETPVVDSRSLDIDRSGDPLARVLSICDAVGTTEYISGPAARSYIDDDQFAERGITLSYANYSGYPTYPQQHGDFDHAVSIIDLICNVGVDNAHSYMLARQAPERLVIESDSCHA